MVDLRSFPVLTDTSPEHNLKGIDRLCRRLPSHLIPLNDLRLHHLELLAYFTHNYCHTQLYSRPGLASYHTSRESPTPPVLLTRTSPLTSVRTFLSSFRPSIYSEMPPSATDMIRDLKINDSSLVEPETTIARQPNSPFLSLPQEMRNRVYEYLTPSNKWMGNDIHREEAKSGALTISGRVLHMIAGEHQKNLRTDPNRKDDAFFGLYRTCRQLYHEVLPLWFKYNVVYIKDDSICFPKTFDWFDNLSNNTYQLVKYVEVRIPAEPLDTLSNGMLSLVEWLSFEHIMLEQGVQLHVIAPSDDVSHHWWVCHRRAMQLKDEGTSPEGIQERFKDTHNRMLEFSALLRERNGLPQHVRIELPWNRKMAKNWWRFWKKKTGQIS